MELEEKYENLLIEIQESAKERFENEFVIKSIKEDRINLLDELNQLISYELVEFDKTDNAYYLTYEGYEKVEGIKELREVGEQMTELEYQHLLRKSRNQKIGAIVGGAFIILITTLMLIGIRTNTKPELTPELLNEVKEKVTVAMDSIKYKQVKTQVNKEWNWSGVIADKILDTNDFGNIIFESDKGNIYRICPEDLSIESIASNIDEYEVLKLEDEFILDWEMTKLVELAKIEVGELNEFEKYCLKIPAVISQDYSSKNIGKIKFSELISVSGDLAYQIRDLEDGQKVKLKIID